jgi:hypothetical protein
MIELRNQRPQFVGNINGAHKNFPSIAAQPPVASKGSCAIACPSLETSGLGSEFDLARRQ